MRFNCGGSWRPVTLNEGNESVQKFARKVYRLNPGIRANDDFAQKCREHVKCRARLVILRFEALYEIDPKVKGTPFARFRH